MQSNPTYLSKASLHESYNVQGCWNFKEVFLQLDRHYKGSIGGATEL